MRPSIVAGSSSSSASTKTQQRCCRVLHGAVASQTRSVSTSAAAFTRACNGSAARTAALRTSQSPPPPAATALTPAGPLGGRPRAWESRPGPASIGIGSGSMRELHARASSAILQSSVFLDWAIFVISIYVSIYLSSGEPEVPGFLARRGNRP